MRLRSRLHLRLLHQLRRLQGKERQQCLRLRPGMLGRLRARRSRERQLARLCRHLPQVSPGTRDHRLSQPSLPSDC